MEKLIEKEVFLIEEPIISLVEELLLNNFSNRKGQLVIKVKNIPYLQLGVDEEASSFKERIIVQSIECNMVNVIVNFGGGATTNNTLNLRTNKGLILNYDNETKKYMIEDVEGIRLLDITPY